MLIKDAIREANTEHEIFFLLTAYVEALGYCDKLNLLPWQMRDLPVAGADDVKARVYGLHLRLHGLNPDSDTAIQSAIHDSLKKFEHGFAPPCFTPSRQQGGRFVLCRLMGSESDGNW